MKTINDDIRACAEAISKITEDVVFCGKLIADCCERHKGFIDSLAHACPDVSRSFLTRLCKVGRGQLDPRIALGIEHGIFAEKLSIEDQHKILDNGVEVAVGEHGSDTMVLRLEQMDKVTASRVIRGATIATISQQRADIFAQEDANNRTKVKAEIEIRKKEETRKTALKALPLKFNDDRSVTVIRQARLTLPQLYLIISELERQ